MGFGAGLEQDHGPLGRTSDHPLAGAASGVTQPGDPELEGTFGTVVDRELVWADAQGVGEDLARGVEEGTRPPRGLVEPGGIGPGDGERRLQRAGRDGVEGSPRGVQETRDVSVGRGARHG